MTNDNEWELVSNETSMMRFGATSHCFPMEYGYTYRVQRRKIDSNPMPEILVGDYVLIHEGREGELFQYVQGTHSDHFISLEERVWMISRIKRIYRNGKLIWEKK